MKVFILMFYNADNNPDKPITIGVYDSYVKAQIVANEWLAEMTDGEDDTPTMDDSYWEDYEGRELWIDKWEVK